MWLETFYVNSTVTEITNPYFIINEGNSLINNTGIVVSQTGVGGASTGAYVLVNSTSNGWQTKAGAGPVVNLNQDIGTGASPSFTTVYASSINGNFTGSTVNANTVIVGTGTVTNLTATNFTGTNAWITNLTGTVGTIATFSSTTGTITSLTGATLTFGTGTVANLASTNATVTNFTGTNAWITNLTGTVGTIATFSSTTGTITNLSSTYVSSSSLTGGVAAFTGGMQFNTSLTAQKFYSIGQTTAAANGTGPVGITFGNGSFACKVMAVLTEINVPNNISTLLFNACGGTTDNSTPTNNIALANITEWHATANTKPWSTTVTPGTNTITFNANATSTNGYNFSISVDFLAHASTAKITDFTYNGSSVSSFNY